MTRKRTLLLLGGSRYLEPVIESAHSLGLRVVTCDYLPDNWAHQHSDEYVNVSVVDRDAVLAVARSVRADGIMSFACDPGVVTAAYVAECMGLPFQGPYESVCTLQDKGLFRSFLADNGFRTPRSRRYRSAAEAVLDAGSIGWPVMVKPVDSAGSKGVTRVDCVEELSTATAEAERISTSGAVMIEEFISFEGYHSSTDPFTVDGELVFCTYSDQLFDSGADNPYTPSLIVWPSTMADAYQAELTGELQRLACLLELGTGIYNVETCVGADSVPYLMEVSPRGGGCRIAELQRMAYGVDLVGAEVRKAVGLPVGDLSWHEPDGAWCELVVHATAGQAGRLERIDIDPQVRSNNVMLDGITARPGDEVRPFTGANMALGDLFLRFDSREELDDMVSCSREWLRVVVS